MSVENPRNIDTAKDFDSAIEIIPQEVCEAAIFALQMELSLSVKHNTKDAVMIPILRGGKRVGDALSTFVGIYSSPMQMSYYDQNNIRMDKPICLKKPDISQIIIGDQTRDIYFGEGVVDSEATILEAENIINQMVTEKGNLDGKEYKLPIYHTYALISKVRGNPQIPNFIFPLLLNSDIWAHGWDFDNGQKGRELNSIFGVLSPFATDIPKRPYYRTTGIYERHFKAALMHLSMVK